MASSPRTMAFRAVAALYGCLSIARNAAALQVTPNSPCSSLCIDDSSLDPSDPNSSNTQNSDILCSDSVVTSSSLGSKWMKCMGCLQNSTFVQGIESDQGWFLYNMRYNFDFCIFGFPNATGVSSTPCSTETACGQLQTALQDGNLRPVNASRLGYCTAAGGAMKTNGYDKCLACVGASGDTNYIANSLVALEAGCLQNPAPNQILGLNGSIFSSSAIGIVDPSKLNSTDTSSDSSAHLPTTTTAIIVVGVLVLVAVIAAFIYIRLRKRRAKYAQEHGLQVEPKRRGHRPKSSLSFRCQTQMPPTPKFFPDNDLSSIDEMSFHQPAPQPTGITSSKRNSLWKPYNAMSAFRSDVPAVHDGGDADTARSTASIQPKRPALVTNNFSKPMSAASAAELHHITTSMPARPVHTYASPTSTTSAKSTTALLPSIAPYNPAEHGTSSPRLGSEAFSSPISASTSSPLLNQHAWASPVTGNSRGAVVRGPDRAFGSMGSPVPPPPPRTSRIRNGIAGSRKVKDLESGSPVESTQVTLEFPPPPPPRK